MFFVYHCKDEDSLASSKYPPYKPGFLSGEVIYYVRSCNVVLQHVSDVTVILRQAYIVSDIITDLSRVVRPRRAIFLPHCYCLLTFFD